MHCAQTRRKTAREKERESTKLNHKKTSILSSLLSFTLISYRIVWVTNAYFIWNLFDFNWRLTRSFFFVHAFARFNNNTRHFSFFVLTLTLGGYKSMLDRKLIKWLKKKTISCQKWLLNIKEIRAGIEKKSVIKKSARKMLHERKHMCFDSIFSTLIEFML